MPLLAFLDSRTGRALRALVSAVAVAILLSLVNWTQMTALANQVEWPLMLLGLSLTLSSYPLCAGRWWYLMRAQGIELSYRRAHAVTWIGQFYNAFLPGGIGGDLTRLLYSFADEPARKTRAALAIAADRIIGFGVLLCLAVPLAVWHSAAVDLRIAGQPLAVLASVCVFASLVLAVPLFRWVVPKLPTAIREGLQALAGNVRANTVAALLSVGVWLLDFLGGWALAGSLGLDLAFPDVALALTVAYLSTALPLSIGGHGLREGALILTLVALKAPATTTQLTELALAFLLVNIVSSLVGGLATFSAPQSGRQELR